MKLYDFVGAPNPKRVRVYLAEKGMSIPTQQVNILSGENRTPEFLAKNPMGGLPVLELDDGTYLPESLAIMEYLEDLNPTPPMIGTTPAERARVRALERIAELSILGRVAAIFQNTHPFFAGRVKQSPDAADTARNMLKNASRVLDGLMPTIADCTLVAAFNFAEFAGVPMDPECANLQRWWSNFKERPSAQA
jgi:glutathione S-transferase